MGFLKRLLCWILRQWFGLAEIRPCLIQGIDKVDGEKWVKSDLTWMLWWLQVFGIGFFGFCRFDIFTFLLIFFLILGPL